MPFLLNFLASLPNCKPTGWSPSFYPPEILYYKNVEEYFPISLEKIDTYCWGMSMLQFLAALNIEELDNLTYKMKNSFEGYCIALENIKKTKVPELGEKTRSSIMRVISKCLEFSPCTRLNMNDVLTCLAYKNAEFSDIISSLSEKKLGYYSKEIMKLIAPSKVEEEKKILQITKRVVKNDNSLFVSAFKGINELLNSKEILTDPSFTRIANLKDEKIKIISNCRNFIFR